MPQIPLAPMERLMKAAGADRVSVEACRALRDVLEERALEITEKAIKLANHAGRKTVRADDIKLAK